MREDGEKVKMKEAMRDRRRGAIHGVRSKGPIYRAPTFVLGLFLFWFMTSSIFAADFELKSQAFKNGEMIPAKYTCDAQNVSPALEWSGAPASTQSFALIADDPDARTEGWTHWVLFDLPPMIENLPEGLPPIDRLGNGEIQGGNDFKKKGYGGPCPPQGSHRYFFTLYALDTALHLEPGISVNELKSAMDGHVIAKTELMGRYQRTKA